MLSQTALAAIPAICDPAKPKPAGCTAPDEECNKAGWCTCTTKTKTGGYACMNPANGQECENDLCSGDQSKKCCKPKAVCAVANCKDKTPGCTGTFEADATLKCADTNKVCCKVKTPTDTGGGGGGTTPAASYDLAQYAPITGDIPTLIGQIIKGFMGIVGSLALLSFVYGGFLMLVSQGDAAKVKKGKDTMIWATGGLVVIFGSYIFLSYVITKLVESGSGVTSPGKKVPCPQDHPECKDLGKQGYECVTPGSNSSCTKACCKKAN